MSHPYLTAALPASLAALLTLGATHVSYAQSLSSQQQLSPAAHFAKGAAALQAGDLPTAETEFRAVTHLDPASAGGFTNLGVTLMREKKLARSPHHPSTGSTPRPRHGRDSP